MNRSARGCARLGAGALLALAACNQTPFFGGVRTFNRPVQVAMVCLETATGRARPITDCTPTSSNTPPAGLAMHALVLQAARGEVAAIDLVSRVVVDTNPAIPGYTFVPVDPLPTGILVPPTAPACAFVSSSGAETIDAIDLRIFRRESRASAVLYDPLLLPGAPVAMVLDPSEEALWVAMPDRSSVARVAIDGCRFGEVEEIRLETTVPPGRVAPPEDDDPTSRYCPADFGAAELPSITARAPEGLEDVARPAALAIGRELLVGDRGLPLVHRIDLDTRALLEPMSVGAPVRALAVTPEVPRSYERSSSERARYLYAIDDTDGTVMAVDYSEPGSPTFGAVLPIGASSSVRPDRMPLLVGARTLEVLRPQYDERDPFARLCNPASIPDDVAAPSHQTMRGVFLAVGMTDATVRFVDVFDSDAPCRGRIEGEASDCTSTTDRFVYVRRHHPRLGERRTTVGVTASEVSYLVNGATVRLTEDSADLAIITCPDPLRAIFAGDETRARGRVCGRPDPFEAVSEVWQAAWQGALSGAASSTGNFQRLEAETVALDARVDFCAAGVLGAEQLVGAPSPESSFEGDVLAITTPLRAARAMDERCQAVVGVEGGNQSPRPVLIPIRSASSRPEGLNEPYRGRLLLDASAPVLDREGTLTLEDVLACFGDELVRFDVRTRGSFSVTGSRSGQRHRVVRGSDGTCGIDASLAETRQSRALPGALYRNDLVAFQVVSRPASGNTELRVTIGTVPATLNIDVGAATGSFARGLALPSDLLWSDVNQRLYIVDVERRGLLELTTQPLGYTQSRFE
ncbi:MAG: hypothetical protein ACK6CU_03370 [Deltaproteobacteria bacterium]